MKYLLFGTGTIYRRNKQRLLELLKNDDIVAFLDNNNTGIVDEIPVYSPNEIGKLDYDRILIMTAAYKEVHEQLRKLGVPEGKIQYWELFRAENSDHNVIQYNSDVQGSEINSNIDCKIHRILIVAWRMNYDGGTLAAVYACKALIKLGYDVALATPEIDDRLLTELCKEGLHILKCGSLPIIGNQEKEWISKYDVVLVNVFPMIESACEIAKKVPVLWWIHESGRKYSSIYPEYSFLYSSYVQNFYKDHKEVYIAAVSKKARQGFEELFPDRVNSVIPLGIPDVMNQGLEIKLQYTDSLKHNVDKKITIAVIGGISKQKGQDIFLNAVQMLDDVSGLYFEMVGKTGTTAYSKEIQKKAESMKNVIIAGELTREEMHEEYKNIDVVLCSSRDETLSITIVEGLMYGKVVITTDAAGVADYIEDGKNGFVFRSEDASSLAETIRFVAAHWNDMGDIRRQARKTYEDNFSMDAFGLRLEKEMKKAKEYWKEARSE